MNWIIRQWINLRWAVKNMIAYRKIVAEMRPWDYIYVLRMLSFQIKILCDHIEKYSWEEEKGKQQKIQDMRRFIELSNHHFNDDYYERAKNNLEYAINIEEREWEEMINILKNMRSWWD